MLPKSGRFSGGHVRISIAILSLISTLFGCAVTAQTVEITAEQLLDRGITNYRAGKLENAASDLKAATNAFLSQDRMQSYVSSGQFDSLNQLEIALIYLTIAQSKLGREADARESVLRLMSAERIEPTYARLPLPREVAEFESLALRLVPSSTLSNYQVAGKTPPPQAPKPAQAQVAVQVAPAPAPVVVAQVAPPPATPAPTPTPAPAPPPVQAAANDRTERERYIEQRIAEERAKLEKLFNERFATERASLAKSFEERLASERTSIQTAADQRIATERAAIQRSADGRQATITTQMRRMFLVRLREADELAFKGYRDDANAIYVSIVNAEDAPRDIAAEAAVGLYRTGAFRNAATAFRRLGAFGRGEEDLRYYNAVSLYETGQYADASRELSCALPFIHVTEDVTRYQQKIERTASRQALR